MKEKEIYQAAIDTFGEDHQIDRMIEEMSEVTHALLRQRRCKHGVIEKDNVYEELADLEIVLEQMKIIFGYENVLPHKTYKLARLEYKINSHVPNQVYSDSFIKTIESIDKFLEKHEKWREELGTNYKAKGE